VSRVRRSHPTGLLPAIERKGVGKFITPETSSNRRKRLGLLRQTARVPDADEFSQSVAASLAA
jgi:hypothetical protein